MPRSTRSKDKPADPKNNRAKKDKPEKEPPSLNHMEQLISKVQKESATMKANMLKVSQQLDRLVQAQLPFVEPPAKKQKTVKDQDKVNHVICDTAEGTQTITRDIPAAQGAAGSDTRQAEDEVSSAVRKLVSFHDDEVVNDPGEALNSFLIAGSTVDPKIKAKIWANEFVELGSLLPKNQTPPGLNIHSELGHSSQFSLTSSRVKQPYHIQEWHKWFCMFAAIYTQKFPKESPSLFTYMSRIFALKDKHPNTYIWREYDCQFRRVRSFVNLPWHVLNMQILSDIDLNSRSSSTTNKSNNSNNNKSSNGKSFDSKVCFEFNKSSGCSDKACKYPHRCSLCGYKNHPRVRCNRNSKKPDTNSK